MERRRLVDLALGGILIAALASLALASVPPQPSEPEAAGPGGVIPRESLPEEAAPERRTPQVSAKTQPARGCLDGVPGAAQALRGLDAAGATSLYRAERRELTWDEESAAHAFALARETGSELDADDLHDLTIERIEVCSFPHGPGLQRVILFRTLLRHDVTLDSDAAMRALTLHESGVPVEVRDVLDIEHTERTERAYDEVVDGSADAVGLALGEGGAEAPQEARPEEEGRREEPEEEMEEWWEADQGSAWE